MIRVAAWEKPEKKRPVAEPDLCHVSKHFLLTVRIAALHNSCDRHAPVVRYTIFGVVVAVVVVAGVEKSAEEEYMRRLILMINSLCYCKRLLNRTLHLKPRKSIHGSNSRIDKTARSVVYSFLTSGA